MSGAITKGWVKNAKRPFGGKVASRPLLKDSFNLGWCRPLCRLLPLSLSLPSRRWELRVSPSAPLRISSFCSQDLPLEPCHPRAGLGAQKVQSTRVFLCMEYTAPAPLWGHTKQVRNLPDRSPLCPLCTTSLKWESAGGSGNWALQRLPGEVLEGGTWRRWGGFLFTPGQG